MSLRPPPCFGPALYINYIYTSGKKYKFDWLPGLGLS